MPISIKLCTKYPWVKGIQNCSNKGSDPLQRGDNYKNAKLVWAGSLKNLRFSSQEPLSQKSSHESFMT
jgi:hypothetical protein